MLRFRSDLDAHVGVSHPHRLEIEWAFGSPSGLPDDVTLGAMEGFEDRLMPAMRAASALLVSVTTGGGVRRWTVHAAERAQTMARIRAILATTNGGAGVTVDAADDPGWSKYRQLVASAKRQ